jgi:hypothetical protein
MDVSQSSGDSADSQVTLEQVKNAASSLQRMLHPFQKKFAPKVAAPTFDTNRMEQFWETYQGEIVQCCVSALSNVYLQNIVPKQFPEVEKHIQTIVQYASANPVSEEVGGAYSRMETDFYNFKNRTGRFQKFANTSEQETDKPKQQPLANLLGEIKIQVVENRGKNVQLGVEAPADKPIELKPKSPEPKKFQIDPMALFNEFGDKDDENDKGTGGRGR